MSLMRRARLNAVLTAQAYARCAGALHDRRARDRRRGAAGWSVNQARVAEDDRDVAII